MVVGRLGLPSVEAPIAELLGSEVTTTGDSTAVGQRRVKGFTLALPVHGGSGDADPYATGMRMRRQLRAMIQNAPYRLAGIFCRFWFDPERDGWMVIGTGTLSDQDAGGITLGEFLFTIDNAYRVAGINTHREGYRVDLTDMRLATSPIDYFGQVLATTGFASLTAIALLPLPTGAYDPTVLDGPVGATVTRTGLGGPMLVVVNQSLLVQPIIGAQLTPSGAVVSWERPETSFGLGDVIAYDRRGFLGPFGTGYDLFPNLITNPSFTAGTTTGWAVTGTLLNAGAILSVVAIAGPGGSLIVNACQVATTATTNEGMTTPVTCAASTQYTVSVYIRGLAGGEQVQLIVNDAGTGSTINNAVASATLTTNWTRLAVTGTTGSNSATFNVVVRTTTATVRTFFVDQTQCSANATAITYCDGDQGGGLWAGTPSQSVTIAEPQLQYGWEEVPGADYPYSWLPHGYPPTTGILDVPVLTNGLCRVRYDAAVATPGFRVDTWTGSAWTEQGKVLIQRIGDQTTYDTVLLSASVLEYTTDRCVVEAVMQSATDTYSRERVLITLQRGWLGPRFEAYLPPEAAGTYADGAIWWCPATADTNDSAITVSPAGTGHNVATAGSGSALFSTTVLGAFGAGENWLALLRQPTGYQVNIAVLQSALGATVTSGAALAYAANQNAVEVLSSTATGYVSAHIGFAAQQADQIMEAEAMTLGSGTAATADGTSSSGTAATSVRTTDANAHVSRANWPNSDIGTYRIFARVRVSAGTGSVYAKILPSTVGPTVTTTSTVYTWLDLGELTTAAVTLEVHAWISVGSAGPTIYVDRIEAVITQDRSTGTGWYAGSKDLGQQALYDGRVELRRLLRG